MEFRNLRLLAPIDLAFYRRDNHRPMKTPTNRTRVLCLLLLAALAFTLDTGVAASMANTTDEVNHLDYGKRILRFQPDRAEFLG